MLVLHGWAQSAHNQTKWQPFLDQLSSQGVDAYFLGLPGLSTPIPQPWTLDDYVEWLHDQVEAEMESKKTDQVLLLGHSFGGQLALRFTHRYPHLVHALILVDSAGIRDARLHKRIKRGVFWLLAKLGRFVTNVPWARSVLYKLARERDYFEASPIMRQTMKNVLSEQVVEDLPTISQRVLIVWGRNDQATPLFLGERLHQGLRQSELHVINGARHSPQFTHTAETAALVSDFMVQLGKQGA